METSGIEAVPTEMIYEFMLKLPYPDLIPFCSTNVRVANICKDDYFWKKKYTYDFGETVLDYDNWKQQYEWRLWIADKISGFIRDDILRIYHLPFHPDRRYRSRGKVCRNFSKAKLIDVLWNSKIYPPSSLPRDDTTIWTRDLSVIEILQLDLIDKINFYYSWVLVRSKKDICEFLKNFLQNHNIVKVLT